jgi:predicted phosphodiesterase
MYICNTHSNVSPLYLIVALVVVSILSACGYAEITKGPFLLAVDGNRAALMWETDTEGGGKVSYGEDQKLEKHIETEPERLEYKAKEGGTSAVGKTVFIHKAWLEDLEAGRDCFYRIAGPESESKIYKFHTVPAGTNEVRFAVYGDSRSNPERHRKIVEQILKQKVDFVVNSGDVVTNGDKYEQWGPQFFEPLKGLAETVPVYIAKGNHEGRGDNFEKLLIPEGWTNNFGFDYGPVHYFCADNVSNEVIVEECLSRIGGDAESSQSLWKFVSYHVPTVNFGGHWSDWGCPEVFGILSRANVDFVIAGHSHQYERFHPIAPARGTTGSFVTYITAGGGGAPLYDVEPAAYHACAEKIHHFCLFEIKANTLVMDTIDIDGRVIDHLEITKTASRLDRQYLLTAVPMKAVRFHQELNNALKAPLPAKPQKSRPFIISYKLSSPALASPAEITFKLRGDESAYQLPEPKTVTMAREGGQVSIELTVTPLVDIEVPARKRRRAIPIEPALWVDCHYEIGWLKEAISRKVLVESSKPR